MRILVIGGTGVVGRPTAAELVRRGHRVAVLTRGGRGAPAGTESFTGDLTTGAGLAAALEGADTVVDVANLQTMSKATAIRYFTDTTRRLGSMAHAAGVGHHVVLGIVSSDRVPFPYYAGKLAQEQTALAGPVPATVLRATQFHEFAEQALGAMRIGPLSLVPDMLIQPVAAAEVAAALADVIEAGPGVTRAPDVAGPRRERLPDLARQVVRAGGAHRRVVGLRLPGKLGTALRGGGQLPGQDAVLRGPAFADWLRGASTGPRG
jgi:uncharacterized protein YbjT (DUF2867 family)